MYHPAIMQPAIAELKLFAIEKDVTVDSRE
jgi:hypothetical protein